MSEWYYAHGGEQKGPVPVSELHRLAADGNFDPEKDLVWREGMSDWKPASTVPELSPAQRNPEPAPAAEPAPGASTPAAQPAPATQASPVATPSTAPQTQQPAAQAPASPAGAPLAAPSSGLAIGSLICGIIALITFCVWCLSVPLAIAAIVLGHLSNAKRKADPARYAGAGMAKTGLITGYLAVILTVAFIAYFASLSPEDIENMPWLPEESRQQIRESLEMRDRMQNESNP